ncbi:hypothetical protein VNO80_24056 [Phaseolus coccineus]|uniref:Uncharacterized protein n=1 Tax=Phaseolus coccineus TaxID=3886 RepID=A0AAN9LS77_PHACN
MLHQFSSFSIYPLFLIAYGILLVIHATFSSLFLTIFYSFLCPSRFLSTQGVRFSFIVPYHASLSTLPENQPSKTVLCGGKAAKNALLHIRTLHSHAPLLARPCYLRLDSSL